MNHFIARVKQVWNELEQAQRLLLDPTGERRYADDRPTTALSVDALNALYEQEYEDPRLVPHS